MKILVTGYNGQLGYDVVRVGRSQTLNMIGTTENELDITQEQSVLDVVHQIKPDAIIHCAAYTAVDKAEDEKEICWKVNVDGTKFLAKAAAAVQAKFMYISTDYVFDGEGNTPFAETDDPKPIGYYGFTKYEGEKALQTILDQWFIVRISWVFGRNGNNFVKTMLRLSESRDELKVVCDQFGSPTYTLDLAYLLIDMIQTDKFGIYHATNEGICNWAEFAQEIFKLAGKHVQVEGITTEAYPTKAIRPKNSRMDKQKLQEAGFKPLPSWQDALTRYIQELNLEVT